MFRGICIDGIPVFLFQWYVFLTVTDILWNEILCFNICFIPKKPISFFEILKFVNIFWQKYLTDSIKKTKVNLNQVIFIIAIELGKSLFYNFNKLYSEPFLSITWVLLWKIFRSAIQPAQTAFTCSKSTMETSGKRAKSVQSYQ